MVEIETATGALDLQITDEQKYDAALALLGDVPPLGERMPSAEKLAADDSISIGELEFQAAAAIEALKMRAEKIARMTKEQEERDRVLEIVGTRRKRQIDAIEAVYLSSQTGRKRIKSQQSQNIAATFYDRGVDFDEIDEEVAEEFGLTTEALKDLVKEHAKK